MNNCVPVIILVLIAISLILYLFYVSPSWYYPIVKAYISSDNGETFKENVLTIPINKNIYIKYTISIKTRGLGRLLIGTKVGFTFKYPEAFELYNYTGIEKEPKEKNCSGNKECFFTTISNNMEKTEVILRLPADKNDKITSSTDDSDTLPKPYKLIFECKIPLYKEYRKMLTLSAEEQNTKKDDKKLK